MYLVGLEFVTLPVFWMLVILVLILNWLLRQPSHHLPPRPDSWPLVGNMFNLPNGTPLYRWCQDKCKHNGPVIRVTLGMEDVVFVSDRTSVDEALVKNSWQLAGRPRLAGFELLSGEYNNVSFADPDSPTWKLLRKMLVTSLRNFSTGRAYELRVMKSIEKLCALFDEKADLGEAFDPGQYVVMFVYNYMASTCFGKSFDLEDPELVLLHEANQEFSRIFGRTYSTDLVPALKRLPFDMPDIVQLKKKLATPINSFVERNFREHIDNPSDEITDLTYYLLNLKDTSSDPHMKEVTNLNVREIINEIFNAGTDTTRATLQWLLFCLSRDSNVQGALYEEIRKVLRGEAMNGQPLLAGRSGMKYSEAVLNECIRFGTVAPVGLPRKTITDVRIGQYDIPANTQVFINQFALNHDPDTYPRPYNFMPERYLPDLDPDKVNVTPPPMSFGQGRRSCPGEQSAKSSVWMMMVTLMERYEFRAGDQTSLTDDMYSDSMFDGSPKPYKIIVTKRKV